MAYRVGPGPKVFLLASPFKGRLSADAPPCRRDAVHGVRRAPGAMPKAFPYGEGGRAERGRMRSFRTATRLRHSRRRLSGGRPHPSLTKNASIFRQIHLPHRGRLYSSVICFANAAFPQRGRLTRTPFSILHLCKEADLSVRFLRQNGASSPAASGAGAPAMEMFTPFTSTPSSARMRM